MNYLCYLSVLNHGYTAIYSKCCESVTSLNKVLSYKKINVYKIKSNQNFKFINNPFPNLPYYIFLYPIDGRNVDSAADTAVLLPTAL